MDGFSSSRPFFKIFLFLYWLNFLIKKGGKAWRGFFKVGDELTSGKPDGKEGIYLGQEITDPSHPKLKGKDWRELGKIIGGGGKEIKGERKEGEEREENQKEGHKNGCIFIYLLSCFSFFILFFFTSSTGLLPPHSFVPYLPLSSSPFLIAFFL